MKLVKTSKAMANLADRWFNQREQRLAKEKEAQNLKAKEVELRELLISSLVSSKATGIGGKKVVVKLKNKEKPIVQDWDVVRKFIIDNNAWDILQKRLSDVAVRARQEEDVTIPGIDKYEFVDLSYSRQKEE